MLNSKIGVGTLVLILVSCSSKSINYLELNSFDENKQLQAVIEIPLGTNEKIEYNPLKNTFEQDTLDGQPRVIQFLSYPVNYGFIPSTTMTKNRQGDGDPLDVLVLGKPLKTGQVLTVKPIGLLLMKDNNEWDNKVLSIPIDKKFQTLSIENFEDLSKNHSKIREMIGEWFKHYDKTAKIEILGWSDENRALEEIEKWQISKSN